MIETLNDSSWDQHGTRHDIRLDRAHPGTPGYLHVIQLRSAVYGVSLADAMDPTDAYSNVWLASVAGAPSATIRVTYARRGPIDCEAFFPPRLRRRFGDVMGSASRFCSRAPPEYRLARLLVDAAWRRAVADGIRLDVIDVNVRAVRYYARMGYERVPGSEFVHPLLGTPSVVMFCAAHPALEGTLAGTFAGCSAPLSPAVVRACLAAHD